MLVCTIVLMSGMLLVGMDGRARAIGKMLRQTGVMKMKKERSYRILVILFFFLIIFAIVFGTPFGGLAFVASVSAAMFAVSGFALIYVDRRMPPYARGGSLWSVLAFIGSSFFLIIAFMEEKAFQDYGYLGVPIVIWIILLGALIYVIWKLRRRK
jgi:glucan phosphoethanolaminetransferase (alkaline phosphatase superfamily)